VRQGDTQGGGFGARERDTQRPLSRLLFALFLPKQEKGKNNIGKENDHLQKDRTGRALRMVDT